MELAEIKKNDRLTDAERNCLLLAATMVSLAARGVRAGETGKEIPEALDNILNLISYVATGSVNEEMNEGIIESLTDVGVEHYA